MIVVASDVASEMMADQPDPRLIVWLDRVDPGELWLSAITVVEIKRGIDDLAAGRRKRALLAAFDALLIDDFDSRVLSFDLPAAIHAAQINVDRRRRGRPVGLADTQIAGIAVSRGAAIATRNVRHFEYLSVQVIDPWAASG
jgi:predicted nucleic acid-binding protein